MNDYISGFGLEFNPFLKNAKESLIPTKECTEVQTRLSFLADTKGFGLITGSAGRGKTTSVRRWAAALNPSLFKVVYSSLSTLTVMEFYRNLAQGLGTEPSFRKTDNFRIIQEEINRYALEKRITPIFIIDEADHLGHKILSDLKILFNFDMDSRDRAVILLVGLPQLNNTLNLSVHEPLRQRLVMNYHMEGITKEEGRLYLKQKLESAGCLHSVFDENATEVLLNSSSGTPRLINKLCNTALMIAGSAGKSIVDAETMRKAIEDSHLG